MKRHALALAGCVLLASASASAAPIAGAVLVAAPMTVPLAAPLAAPAAAPPVAPPSTGPTLAASPAWLRPEKPVKPALATKAGPSPLRVGGMLLLVATLGGVAYYARRRRNPLKSSDGKGGLRVLGTTRVGAKAQAVIVEVSGKRLLLGVTDQAVSTLAWLDDEANASVEDVREDASRITKRSSLRPGAVDDVAAAGPSGFLRLLRNAVGSGAKAPAIAADEVAKVTRDEVRLSSRRTEHVEEEPLEGQVMGLAKRRRELP